MKIKDLKEKIFGRNGGGHVDLGAESLVSDKDLPVRGPRIVAIGGRDRAVDHAARTEVFSPNIILR
jgi:hypothetical protein